ncbi:glycosyltransferase family 39 protein [Maridesulfovibrio sp.]|uniref:ArnT family glycosyltransferase n=1 Tax=Maridesulfovibrio sp. TaxID=2795000 RepID=UPI0029C9E09F|nr:glycosyltransferase family 39 protein [Maridesulfovibrio sp.]
MNSKNTISQPLVLSFLIIFSLIFACMGTWRPFFFDIDEPKYISAAMEMAARGDWLHPMFGGLPRMQKPPLPYWLSAPLIDFFGSGFSNGTQLFIARIPAILSSVLTVIATYMTGKKLGSEKCGIFAALLLAVAPPFKIEGMMLKADIIYTAAVSWSTYFFLRRFQGQRGGLNLTGAGICMALGILSRGPFALPPLAGYLCAEFFRRNSSKEDSFLSAAVTTLKKEIVPILMGLVACIPFLLWISAASSPGMDYIGGMLNNVSENTSYATSPLIHHLQSLGFYLFEAGIIFFPLGLFGLYGTFSHLRNKTDRNKNIGMLLWTALFYLLINFFIYRLRAHRYFLPIMPILSIIAVNWLLTAKRDKTFKRVFFGCTALACAIPVGIGAIVLYSGQISVNLWRNAQITDFGTQTLPFAIAAAVLSIVICMAALKYYKKPQTFLAIIFGATLLFYPAYFNACPDVDGHGMMQPDSLLGNNLARSIGKLPAGNYTFIASRRSLRIHPELHFFLRKAIDKSKAGYLVTLPFNINKIRSMLLDPKATALTLKEEGNTRTPLYKSIQNTEPTHTVLILNSLELTLMYRSPKTATMLKTRIKSTQIIGLNHDWETRGLYLLTLP